MRAPTAILRSLIVLVLATTIAVSGADATQASDRAPRARPDQVLVERYTLRSGQFLKTLFLARVDGSEERPLMAAPVGDAANNLYSSWSPDGQWVVFGVLETTGDIPAASVWIVGADGRHPQQVVACSSAPCAQYSYPRWSRDGSELAMIRFGRYAADGSCCTSALVVFDIARSKRTGEWRATNEQVLASFADADVVDTFDSFQNLPAWSPDGRQLAYTVEQFGVEDPFPLLGTRIAVVSRTGGDARFITPLDLNAGNPDWHPCAGLIAITTYPFGSFHETTAPSNVYTLLPDGRRVKQLTTQSVDGSLRFGDVHWTPDGRGFTLTVGRASNGTRLDSIELATLPAKGGTPTELGISGTGSLRPRAGSGCKG
jgi:Tol biopolymer transport system component